MTDIRTLVRPCIANLQPYSSARDEFTGDADVFLDANESPFGSLNRYPDPKQNELVNVLADQKGLSPSQIVVGNGSDEIIDLIFRTFCEPQVDEAAALTPSYGMYQVTAAINNVTLINLPLNTEFDIDASTYEALKDRENVKVVFLCSPNNPTGNILQSYWIEQLLQLDILVVVDEAYIDFAEVNSWTTRLKEFDNLIILQTLSKAWGLANVRIGMALTSPVVADLLNRVKPPYNVSGLNQKAAIEALRNSSEQGARLKLIKSEKERIKNALLELSSVKKIYPSQANFLLVEFNDAKRVFEFLKSNGIIVRDRSSQISNTLRITIGRPEENSILLSTLQNFES